MRESPSHERNAVHGLLRPFTLIESGDGRVQVDGAVRRFDGELAHYSYVDLADHVQRIQEFSGMSARDMYQRGRRVRTPDLVVRPVARFARGYLLKAGFRDGLPGFMIAAATGFYVFLKYAKLWELQRDDTAPP